jgi:hypothetical protein
VARSSLPSRLKCPHDEAGTRIRRKRTTDGGRKRARAISQQDRNVVTLDICRNRVLNAIPVEIPTATEKEGTPIAKGLPEATANPPEPFPSRTSTAEPSTTARSSIASPLKSPRQWRQALQFPVRMGSRTLGKPAHAFPRQHCNIPAYGVEVLWE